MTNTERIQFGEALPEAYGHLVKLHGSVQKAAANAGVDRSVIDLLKIRVSQLNGCSFCTDMHGAEAVKAGESTRRIFLLPTWREATGMFTHEERAALELAEAMTRLPATQEVSDEVYQQASTAFDEAQYTAVAWAVTVINTFNRLGVTSQMALPG